MIVTQKLEVEERGGDGKVRGEKRRGEEGEGKKVHDTHNSNVLVKLSCFCSDRLLFHYLYFQNQTVSPVNDHLHKSIEH